MNDSSAASPYCLGPRQSKLSLLLREFPVTHDPTRWDAARPEWQFSEAFFEHTFLRLLKVSPAVPQMHRLATNYVVGGAYFREIRDLPARSTLGQGVELRLGNVFEGGVR